MSGFVTGQQGLGHVVLVVPDLIEAMEFYKKILGFTVSDEIDLFGNRVVFFHVNPRHHTLALMGIPGRDCYTAAKGAVTSMTRSMAVEFAPDIRVNAIAPSATMTDRVRKLVAGNTALDKMAQAHLLGLIEPEDIAAMALFLASDESRKVTGHIYPVDSGIIIS